ncbi:AAA family ATPase, partial [Glutamicibacter sp.]|uniref:AAA family ATPase n=2 Tax=Glutamicibacter sp. TaxID=1931995 RepID=UPI002B49A6C4
MTANRILLTHLSFVGGQSDPVSIDFDEKLTLILGPSDTGKSFIVDAIDYMLGKQKLRRIPEIQDYGTVLLGLKMPDGTPLTLARNITGGKIRCYRSSIRDVPTGPADFELGAKHDADNLANLSNFLLAEIGLSKRSVRKNKSNVVRSLSFRDLAHLCVIDETRMQSLTPPPLPSAQVIHATVEKSVFKLILQGEDDSGLSVIPPPSERHFTLGKRAMVDRIVHHLLSDMGDIPSVEELREQLLRVVDTTNKIAGSIEQLLHSRSTLIEDLRPLEVEHNELRERLAEIGELIERFKLLQEQYETDLARLAMMQEAGTLLTIFEPGVCILCGALEEHQNHAVDSNHGSSSWSDALEAESRKTAHLSSDLVKTIGSMTQQQTIGTQRYVQVEESLRIVNAGIERLDRDLAPDSLSLKELTEKRISLERAISTFDHVERINMFTSIDTNEVVDNVAIHGALNESVLGELSETIRSVLNSWGIPEAQTVRIDPESQELVVGGRERGSRGKGTRSVLHAAFTVGLGEYCF